MLSAAKAASAQAESHAPPLLSIVMPCLNEAETLSSCILKAISVLRDNGIPGQVIVADNGSTDGSIDIAKASGATIVHVPEKGYGNALIGGISAAHTPYILIADSDDSHDFGDVPRFLQKLGEGFDLVIGNRFKGSIDPGAMSFLHRYVGTPVLTGLGRLFYKAAVGDINCGMRAFTRDAWNQLQLGSPGMEFASEMIVRASLIGLRVAEVPTKMAKDGRGREPHLRTWRDGWRHLRLLLIYSPRWLFLYPGIALLLAGVLGIGWLLPHSRHIGGIELGVGSLLYCLAATFLGAEICFFAAFSKVLGITQGLLPQNETLNKVLKFVSLETGLLVGASATVIAAIYLFLPFIPVTFHKLAFTNPEASIRYLLPGIVVLTTGIHIVFSSFLFSMLGLVKRK